MYPQVPERLEALSVAELDTLAAEIRAACLAALADPELTAEGLATEEEFRAKRTEILALAATKRAAEGDLAEEPEPEPVVEAADETDDDEDEGGEPEASEDEENEPVAVAHSSRAVRTTTSVSASPDASVTAAPQMALDQLIAYESAPGAKAGEPFNSWSHFAESIQEKAKLVDVSAGQKFVVGQARGHFDEDHKLGTNMLTNLALFEKSQEMVAAMCAPAIPTYNLGCANTARRPARGSLAAFQPAQRGKVTVYPSPTLEDITTGVGLWTEADDANSSAVKSACATIECATPVEYVIYGIYRCITIKNLLQMTFPELVEAYLNRLSAAWARLAEVTLLNAMGTAADSVDVTGTGWGGTVSILRGVLQYLNAYQELQRWDVGQLDGWAHRGLLNAIKADIM
jgi:hypothetical protein